MTSSDEVLKGIERLVDGPDNQPFVDDWRYVDSFTVDQAADLWCGIEPRESDQLLMNKKAPKQFGAIKQMLLGEIEAKTLPAKTKYSTLRADGDALVGRIDLVLLAKRKQTLPEFLFDTVAPRNSRMIETLSSDAGNKGKKAGRPLKWNWDAIWAKLLYEAEMNGLPETAEAMGNEIVLWYSKGQSDTAEEVPENDSPDIKTVLERIQPVYRIMKKEMGWVPQSKIVKK